MRSSNNLFSHGKVFYNLVLRALCTYSIAFSPANAGKIWESQVPNGPYISGTNGCAVARAQALATYGEGICSYECQSGPDFAQSMNFSDCQKTAARFGIAGATCTGGYRKYDYECWDMDYLEKEPKDRAYCPIGNPIDPVMGVKTEHKVDLQIGQGGELRLERFYNSNINATIETLRKSRFGYGWRSNFDIGAYFSPTGRVYIVEPSGSAYVFSKQNNGTWIRNYFGDPPWNPGWLPDSTGAKQSLFTTDVGVDFVSESNVK